MTDFPTDIPSVIPPDYADAVRRLRLAQAEINELNAIREMHNEQINTLHRDLHDAAKLIGDIHQQGVASNGVLSIELGERVLAHVEKHGHPQDVAE